MIKIIQNYIYYIATFIFSVLCVLIVSFASGCSTLSFKTPTQQQFADLTISLTAKSIGLKLAADGFTWTDEIENFYRAIALADEMTVDSAALAEKYIRENADPLIVPELIELSKMVGFKFDSGNIVSTDDVNFELLKKAAEGFRLAVMIGQKKL